VISSTSDTVSGRQRDSASSAGGVTATASRLRARLGHVDLLVPSVAAVGLIVYSLHKFDGGLSRDLGIYSYAGQQFAEGEPPYVAVLNRVGPLAHILPGVGVAAARVVGIDDVLGMRLLFLLFAAACLSLAYLLGRDLFSSRLSGLATAAALLAFSGFVHYASNGPREKTAMVLFLLAALLALVRRSWFISGMFVALGTLTWQPVFIAAATAMVVTLVGLPRGERRAAAMRFVIGGLVPTALCIAYFAAVGALRDFFDGFVLISARYAQDSSITSNLHAVWSSLRAGYGASLIVLFLGLLSLACLTAWSLRRESRHNDPAAYPVAAVGIAGLVALVWTTRQFQAWPDAFLLLPFSAVGIGGLVGVLSRRLSGRWVVAVVATFAVTMTAMAVDFALTGGYRGLDSQRQDVRAVLQALPSDASILSIEGPQALVLSNQTNATRHQVFTGALGRYIDDTWPGGRVGYAKWVVDVERPDVVTVGKGQVGKPWLASTLSSQYERVGRSSGWQWYVRRSLGPDLVADVRAALRRAQS
jgi:hypothetical protein